MINASLSRPYADPPPVRIGGACPHPPRARARVHLTPAGALPISDGGTRANRPRIAAAPE